MELHAWGCCGWFLSILWGSKSCLGAGEWERLLPAELILEKSKEKVVLLFSDWEKCWFWVEPLATSLCWNHLDTASNKAIKKKIPLKLSLVFNILFIPMLLCFACGKTASKQPPRSEVLGGWQAFSHELLLQYNGILFAVLFPCLLTFFLTFKEKKKETLLWMAKKRKEKFLLNFQPFFIWYWVACKHFFLMVYMLVVSSLFCALNSLSPSFYHIALPFHYWFRKSAGGKKINRVHILRKRSQRKMDQTIHLSMWPFIYQSISLPTASIEINSGHCTHCWLAEVVIWTKGLFGKRMLKL